LKKQAEGSYYLIYKSTRDLVVGKLIKRVSTYPEALEIVNKRFKSYTIKKEDCDYYIRGKSKQIVGAILYSYKPLSDKKDSK